MEAGDEDAGLAVVHEENGQGGDQRYGDAALARAFSRPHLPLEVAMLTALFTLVAPAWPCAGLFHEAGALAESGAQEAIIEDLGGAVRSSYRGTHSTNPSPATALTAVDGPPPRRPHGMASERRPDHPAALA
jgi:hypothetical protein